MDIPPPPCGFPFLGCEGAYISYGYVITCPNSSNTTKTNVAPQLHSSTLDQRTPSSMFEEDSSLCRTGPRPSYQPEWPSSSNCTYNVEKPVSSKNQPAFAIYENGSSAQSASGQRCLPCNETAPGAFFRCPTPPNNLPFLRQEVSPNNQPAFAIYEDSIRAQSTSGQRSSAYETAPGASFRCPSPRSNLPQVKLPSFMPSGRGVSPNNQPAFAIYEQDSSSAQRTSGQRSSAYETAPGASFRCPSPPSNLPQMTPPSFMSSGRSVSPPHRAARGANPFKCSTLQPNLSQTPPFPIMSDRENNREVSFRCPSQQIHSSQTAPPSVMGGSRRWGSSGESSMSRSPGSSGRPCPCDSMESSGYEVRC